MLGRNRGITRPEDRTESGTDHRAALTVDQGTQQSAAHSTRDETLPLRLIEDLLIIGAACGELFLAGGPGFMAFCDRRLVGHHRSDRGAGCTDKAD